MNLNKNEIQITDNFLEPNDFEHLYNIAFGIDGGHPYLKRFRFKYNYQDKKIDDINFGDYLTCLIYDKFPLDDTFPELDAFFVKLEPNAIARVKANLILKTDKSIIHGMHTDYEKEFVADGLKTSIFYLNTSNGKTHFKNGESVDCIANRLVTFPYYMNHASSSQTDSNGRIVLNVNWY